MDDNLASIAQQALQAYNDGQSIADFCRERGVYDKHYNSIKAKVNRLRKNAELDDDTPDGFALKRRSALYKGDELVMEWRVTEKGKQSAYDDLEAFAEHLTTKVTPRKNKIGLSTIGQDDNLLAVYACADVHIGSFASESDTGESWDTHKAIQVVEAAYDEMTNDVRHAAHGLIIFLGDFTHADNRANTTTAGTGLDVSGHYTDNVRASAHLQKYIIDRALEVHKQVTVIVKQGNHDWHVSYNLAIMLDAFYHEDDRCEIRVSAIPADYFQWGKVLIGATHGDTYKVKDLQGIMAVDARKAWGVTDYWFWFTGHLHHKAVTEDKGVIIETVSTITAKDAWHTAQGYRSQRNIFVQTFDKEYGQRRRYNYSIAYLFSKIASMARTKTRTDDESMVA